MPDGRNPNSNMKAKEYYHNLINRLIEEGITPMVTLYHWDQPSAIYTSDCKGLNSVELNKM